MVGVQTLATGFGLVESPRWHDGRLWFSDWTAGEIRILGDGGRSDVAVRHRSLPLCFDFQPDGTMLVVSAETRTLLRAGAAGELVPYADLSPLRPSAPTTSSWTVAAMPMSTATTPSSG